MLTLLQNCSCGRTATDVDDLRYHPISCAANRAKEAIREGRMLEGEQWCPHQDCPLSEVDRGCMECRRKRLACESH